MKMVQTIPALFFNSIHGSKAATTLGASEKQETSTYVKSSQSTDSVSYGPLIYLYKLRVERELVFHQLTICDCP